MIIPKRRAVGLTSTVAKTSAGALNYTPVAKVTNLGHTIDELKEQTASLLNLVMEGHLPLRVCMNNGKEFLLFPQDLLAPIRDADFRLILLSAMRYAMGRNTYMPAVVSDYIKRHLRFLDDKFLALAADDIQRHLEDYAEHEPNLNLWQNLLCALETEQRERATRQARKISGKPSL